jgi:hypothetical protein
MRERVPPARSQAEAVGRRGAVEMRLSRIHGPDVVDERHAS